MSDAVVELKGQPGQRALVWMCPGCGDFHRIPIEGPNGWEWNGSLASPTLNPSCKGETPFPEGTRVCHFFLRDGMMEFCSDSTHQKAGQHVRLRPQE